MIRVVFVFARRHSSLWVFLSSIDLWLQEMLRYANRTIVRSFVVLSGPNSNCYNMAGRFAIASKNFRLEDSTALVFDLLQLQITTLHGFIVKIPDWIFWRFRRRNDIWFIIWGWLLLCATAQHTKNRKTDSRHFQCGAPLIIQNR